MANVNVNDHKTVSKFMDSVELVKVVYDFAQDGGATANELQLFTAARDLVITDFWVRGITELDSAADGTSIDVGIAGGDEDILLDGVAEATFAADALVGPTVVEGAPNVLPLPLKLAEDGAIQMKVVDEALTSGKCEFNFIVTPFK